MRARSCGLLLIGITLAALSRGAGAEDAMPAPHAKDRAANRLAGERSPYLRQHMHNPVDWRPWGAEALEAARAANRPIFLSIGYAACHWCHVMERESFEDEEAAAVLNEVFVCVKVDREERPDLDDVYMAAVQITSGRGGWPMSVFLLPDGRPFLARTYLPKAALIETARRIQAAWASNRARLVEVAEEIANAVAQQLAGPSLPAFSGDDAALVRAAVEDATRSFDRVHGGFDRVPKFPPHGHLLAFLDRDGSLGGAAGLEMARKTLDAMAAGGVYDQVGGGFHRYSTDAVWLVPHFEKMLYDNALLAQAFALAWRRWQDPRHAEVLAETLAWIEREMGVEGGGYASSLDADTEGEEGLTYTWTPAELREVLSEADARLAEAVFGVTAEGNYHDEASGRATGRSILHRPIALAEAGRGLSRSPAEVAADLLRLRARLLEARARRPQPARDGKVIASWNGLLLSAFAAAGTAQPSGPYLARGRTLATFLLDHCREEGRLLRFPRGSGPAIPAFLDDHAHVADGLLDLAEATGESTWAEAAQALADAMLEHFQDEAGGFWSTSPRHETLLARGKDAFDSPIPSGNATAARVLLRLGHRTGSARYTEAASRALTSWRPLVARAPHGTMSLVRVLADRAAAEAAGTGPAAPDAVVREGPLRVEAFLERVEARPGTSVRVLLRLTLDGGWHVEPAVGAREDLLPTSIALAEKAPVALQGITFPAAVRRALEPGGEPVALHEKTFEVRAVLAIPADAPAGPRRIGLLVGFQPCDATSCRPPAQARLDLPLRFEREDAPPRHPALFR